METEVTRLDKQDEAILDNLDVIETRLEQNGKKNEKSSDLLLHEEIKPIANGKQEISIQQQPEQQHQETKKEYDIGLFFNNMNVDSNSDKRGKEKTSLKPVKRVPFATTIEKDLRFPCKLVNVDVLNLDISEDYTRVPRFLRMEGIGITEKICLLIRILEAGPILPQSLTFSSMKYQSSSLYIDLSLMYIFFKRNATVQRMRHLISVINKYGDYVMGKGAQRCLRLLNAVISFYEITEMLDDSLTNAYSGVIISSPELHITSSSSYFSNHYERWASWIVCMCTIGETIEIPSIIFQDTNDKKRQTVDGKNIITIQ